LEFANVWNLPIFGIRPAFGTGRKLSGRRMHPASAFTTTDVARQRFVAVAFANAWPRVARA
jgi:hypothetical protein